MAKRSLLLLGFSLFSAVLRAQESGASDSVTIRNIFISGNKVTRESVVQRELPFKKGESLSRPALKEEKIRAKELLLNTSLFHEVTITDTIQGNSADIFIHVKERWYIEPAFHFALADRNFNAWWQDRELYRTIIGAGLTDHNFRGLNQQLGADGTVGWRQSLSITYRVPYVNKTQTLGTAVNLSYLQGHEVGAYTEQNHLRYMRVDEQPLVRKITGDFTFTYRKRLAVYHSLRMGYEYYDVADTLGRIRNPEYLGEGRTTLRMPRIAYILTVDKRDNAHYPWRGSYFIGALDQKGLPFVYHDVNIQTLELNYRRYIAFLPKLSLGAGFRTVMNHPDTLPYLLRSSLGYRYQVRGFEYYVLDGYNYFLLTTELRYRVLDRKFYFPWIPFEQFNTVPLQVMVKVLYDQGYVSYPVRWNDTRGNTLLNQWNYGWGAGVDLLSYYDKILRVEYSFNTLGQRGLFLHYIEAF